MSRIDNPPMAWVGAVIKMEFTENPELVSRIADYVSNMQVWECMECGSLNLSEIGAKMCARGDKADRSE